MYNMFIIIILPALQQVSFGHRCLFDRRCTGGDCHQRRERNNPRVFHMMVVPLGLAAQ